jgi:hypothetical protein
LGARLALIEVRYAAAAGSVAKPKEGRIKKVTPAGGNQWRTQTALFTDSFEKYRSQSKLHLQRFLSVGLEVKSSVSLTHPVISCSLMCLFD